MNQRLHDAVVAAQEAFWAKIAAAFPEATSGDFPPGDQLAFDAACMSAATVWVEGNTADPLAGNPKVEVLTNLGYDIDEDSDQPGLWIWTSPSDGCDISYASAQEAADAAWTDAIGQTMGILNLSSEQWDALSLAQQFELVSDTLSGD